MKMRIYSAIRLAISISLISSCAQHPIISHDMKRGIYTINPKKGMYFIEYDEVNPNIINIKSKNTDYYSAWVIVDNKGIRSVQLLALCGENQSVNSDLVGAFVMKDKKIQKIKGFRTGIIAREK
jgi:hypothetical protein